MEAHGRCLTQEKIFFRDTSVLAGANADWGRDSVNNTVISAVSATLYHISISLIVRMFIMIIGGFAIMATGVYKT